MDLFQQIRYKLQAPFGNRIHFILICLLLVVQVLAQNLSYILVGIGVVFWLFRGDYRTTIQVIAKMPLFWLLASFLLLAILGMIYTENLRSGKIAIEQRLNYLIIPILIFSTKPFSKTQINQLFLCFSITWLIVSLVSLFLAYQHNLEVFGEFTSDSTWLFTHHSLTRPIGFSAISTALYIGVAMLWLIHFLLNEWKKNTTIINFALVSLLIYFIGYQSLLASRTLFTSVMLLIFLSLLRHLYATKQLKKLILTLIFVPLLSVFAVSLNKATYKRFKDVSHFGKPMNETQFGGYQLRLEIWESAWGVITQHPFIGVGTGDAWPAIIEQHTKRGFDEGKEKRFHAHNQYLQDWLTWGIFGLLLLLANLILPLWLALKKQQWFYLSFLLFISASCLTDISLGFYKGILFFVLIHCILFHQMQREKTALPIS